MARPKRVTKTTVSRLLNQLLNRFFWHHSPTELDTTGGGEDKGEGTELTMVFDGAGEKYNKHGALGSGRGIAHGIRGGDRGTDYPKLHEKLKKIREHFTLANLPIR